MDDSNPLPTPLVCEIEELEELGKMIRNISFENENLAELKKYHGLFWKLNDEMKGITYDREGRKERLKQDRNTSSSCKFFFTCCYNMLSEMMDMRSVFRADYDQVLNLCSAPGGFSKKLIENSKTVRVTAVTLPTTEPGALDNHFEHPQQTLIRHNVVKIAQMPIEDLHQLLGCSKALEWRRSDANVVGKPKFELALLDGAFASDQEETGIDFAAGDTNERTESFRNMIKVHLQLRMSEIAITTATLKQGGMMIVRSSAKIQNPTLWITWLLLNKLFQEVELYNPSATASKSMWSQSFVYFVCRGFKFGLDEFQEKYLLIQGYLMQVAKARYDFIDELWDSKAIEKLLSELERIWVQQTKMFKERFESMKDEKSALRDGFLNCRGSLISSPTELEQLHE